MLKLALAIKYTVAVVAVATVIRCPISAIHTFPLANVVAPVAKGILDMKAESSNVAEEVFKVPVTEVQTVDASPVKAIFPPISQSPGVKTIEVILVVVALARDTADPIKTDASINSPTLPAAALLFVVVPMMPEVVLGEKLVPVTLELATTAPAELTVNTSVPAPVPRLLTVK